MKLSVIVPCHNEAESLPYFVKALQAVAPKLDLELEVLFINDGSTDATLKILRQLNQTAPATFHYLSFSRNFGKEAAIYAGLQAATGDLVSLMDADLQDPPELLLEMYQQLQADPEIDCVAARRSTRAGESKLISSFSKLFYRIVGKISSTPMVDGVRDFRMMRRPMVTALLELCEYNRFSKGLFTWIGFETRYLAYENQTRVAGKTSWNFWSLLKYSLSAFVNFSEAPLQIAMYSGFLVVVLDLLAIVFLIIRQLLFNNSVSGWTSLTVILLFCFGFTLLMLGIIGKYISSIFLEVKQRPIYIIKEKSK